MNISFVITILIIIFIVIVGILTIISYFISEIEMSTPAAISCKMSTPVAISCIILLFLFLVADAVCLTVVMFKYAEHYPEDCVADYSKCQTQTITKYYEQDGSIYTVIGDKVYLITHKNEDDYICSDECIVKLNNEQFSDCFVRASETVIYREEEENWFTEKTFGQNTLYVNDETYNKLLNITPLDVN